MSDQTIIMDRPEYIRDTLDAAKIGDIKQPLTFWEKLSNIGALRKGVILLLLACIWQAYAVWVSNPLIFPTFTATTAAFWDALVHGGLMARTWVSLKLLLMGYSAGIFLATVMTVFAISTRIGNDFLETLTSMFNPLPAIALLPLSLLWFGLGNFSIIFVLIHSVLWPVSLNTHGGFRASATPFAWSATITA